MEKVILPINLAFAMNNIKDELGEEMLSSFEFLISHYKKSQKYTGQLQESIDTLVNFVRESTENRKLYYQAIVLGYEREKTPEEKLYDYYMDLIACEDNLEDSGQSGSQYRQGWQSVEKTLEILGLNVKGITC